MNQATKNTIFKIVIPILLALAVVISTLAIIISDKNKHNDGTSSAHSEEQAGTLPEEYEKNKVEDIKALSIRLGKDVETSKGFDSIKEQINKTVNEAKLDKFNCIELYLNFEDKLIYDSVFGETPFEELISYTYGVCKSNSLKLGATVDLSSLTDDIVDSFSEKLSLALADKTLTSNCDMLTLANAPFHDNKGSITKLIDKVNESLYYSNPTLYFGIEFTETEEALADGEDTNELIALLNDGKIDFITVYNTYSLTNDPSFESKVDEWKTAVGDKDIFFKLKYDNLGLKLTGWEKTDQIAKQLLLLSDKGITSFILDGAGTYFNKFEESRSIIVKFLADQYKSKFVLTDLSITSPTSKNTTVDVDTISFIGASDPEFFLGMNGKEVERTEFGYFSFDEKLELGKNTFVFEHKGVKTTYTVTYKRVVISDYSPKDAQKLDGGSNFVVSVKAISGSKVTAKLSAETITLNESIITDDSGNISGEYSNYYGTFSMPTDYNNNLSLGKITFTAVSKYGTETKQSGTISVLKSVRPVEPKPEERPLGGNYINVGNTYVAEVVSYQAETFTYGETGDYSRPTNNYLPKGTVDYCSASDTVFSVSSGNEYVRALRFGRNVYSNHKKEEVIKIYEGTLPDTNKVSLADISCDNRFTYLTMNVDWKAPFTLDIGPQDYISYGDSSGSGRDYRIKSATYNYVDITFCYCTEALGEFSFPADDRIFAKGEWIKNEYDYTLRLYLKRTGEFYGWTSYYNDKGQLVFKFLNPAIIKQADNSYGYDLTGVIIMIDVGHGGSDSGAHGSNKEFSEAKLNLILAEKLKRELESMGAKVYMDRTDNSTSMTADQRIIKVMDSECDMCICIHRNWVSSSDPHAFNSYSFNAYSYKPAVKVNESVSSATWTVNGKEELLWEQSKWSGVKWHNYFVSRISNCPVVLTENGFMSNADEFTKMLNDEFNDKCAVAMAQGIANYFASIQFS